MALKIPDFCYSFVHTGISMLTVCREIISKDENVFLPGSQQIRALAGCLFPLPGRSPRGRIKWGTSPTAPPQGFQSNALPAEQPSQASARLSTSPFALESTRLELRLEMQGLLVCPTPTAPLFIWRWQTGPLTQDKACPVIPEAPAGSCLPTSRRAGPIPSAVSVRQPSPWFRAKHLLDLEENLPSPSFAACVLLSTGLSMPQHWVNVRN